MLLLVLLEYGLGHTLFLWYIADVIICWDNSFGASSRWVKGEHNGICHFIMWFNVYCNKTARPVQQDGTCMVNSVVLKHLILIDNTFSQTDKSRYTQMLFSPTWRSQYGTTVGYLEKVILKCGHLDS